LGALVFLRLDVRELEELHSVQLPLRFAHLASRKDVAFLVRQLPANDDVVDALLTVNLNGTEVCQRAGRRSERDLHLPVTRALLRYVHLRVRITVIAQRVERTLARGDRKLSIERSFRLEWQ
jgi:hypothetical protein